MTDNLKNNLTIGQTVAVYDQYLGGMRTGIIKKFTPKRIVIEIMSPTAGMVGTYYYTNSKVLSLNIHNNRTV